MKFKHFIETPFGKVPAAPAGKIKDSDLGEAWIIKYADWAKAQMAYRSISR